MSFGTKKIRKFLSLSLITSSFCLPWFSRVNAGLEGRIATMEDFEKFTSELESIFEKISKDYGKKAIEKYYNMLKNNEENANLEFARQILGILEKNGIKSDILVVKRSIGLKKTSYTLVIYPISIRPRETKFVVVDPIGVFFCYYFEELFDNYKRFFCDEFNRCLTLNSWKDLCCLDADFCWDENNVRCLVKNDGTRVFVHNNDKKLGVMSVKDWMLDAVGVTGEAKQESKPTQNI